MKKLLLSLILLFTICAARAQYISLPDSNWGNWLNANGFSSCLIGNGSIGWQLDTNCSAVRNATSVYCVNNRPSINDLTGITYFGSLTTLSCGQNQLARLPALPASLQYLYCPDNLLQILPTLPAGLQELNCSSNQLISLPALPAGLQQFYCENNQLSSLPALPASLGLFYCGNNQLSSLPTLPASLEYLYCSQNQLSSLLALPNNLISLDCSQNQISSLPTLPTSFKILVCNQNQLSSLPALPVGFQSLFCSNNQLSSLPVFPAGLRDLDCSSNQLSSLPPLPSGLQSLYCGSNPSLNCLPRIYASSIQYFYMSGTNIRCLLNRFTATNYDINPAILPLCEPSSGCDFYYNIAGNIHNDTSTSCQQDSLNPGTLLRNMKVQLKQNGQVQQQFYTFNSGNYSFKTDSLVSYEVTIDTAQLPFTVSCPSSGSRLVALSPTDSVRTTENFGLECGAVDFGVVSISGARFRPTFSTTVYNTAGNLTQLLYSATCGVGTLGIVTTTFSGAITYTGPAAGALSPSVSGNTLTYNIADLNTLQAGSLDIIVTTDTNAAIGSQVCITTTITPSVPDANATNNTLTQCFAVRNSYDPNLKEVYPTALQQNQSEWLTYTIHFQNTGNDTAYTVVVRDTLSNNVLPETFQYLASSHHAVIQLFGKAMVFTFPKINLVDSATNPPLSEGWIQYKVKTKPNLPLTTQVKNTAYIYFDLNPAVVTNTAVSTVTITGIEQVKDMGVVRLYPNPNKGSFTLESSITDGEYRIYDMMGAVIAQQKINSVRELVSLTDAAAGVYTLVVKNGTDSRAMRLMIER